MQLLLPAGANTEAADKVLLMIHYCMAVYTFCSPISHIGRVTETDIQTVFYEWIHFIAMYIAFWILGTE